MDETLLKNEKSKLKVKPQHSKGKVTEAQRALSETLRTARAGAPLFKLSQDTKRNRKTEVGEARSLPNTFEASLIFSLLKRE